MILEPIGIITIIAGLMVLRKGPDLGIVLLMLASLLGAAAAIKLPALGGSSVLPAHLLMPFYVVAVVRQLGFGRVLRTMTFPAPGFWLALFVAYGLLSAVFMPRLFAGDVEVFSIARDAGRGSGIVMTPLAPRAGNITQALYIAGDLALFAAVAVHAAVALRTVVRAFLIAAAANLCFAALDLSTHALGLGDLLEVIRNANYNILAETDMMGLKRIVGSFPEASAFGGVTLVYFAFATELWLRGAFAGSAGPLALLSLMAVLACTSSATYVGLAIYGGLVLMRCSASLAVGTASPRAAAVALLTPAMVLLVVLPLLLMPTYWDALTDLAERAIFDKLNTESGIERSLWNEHGLRAFFATSLLGAGVGSVRTSSFLVATLANTGLAGLIFIVLFLASGTLSIAGRAQDPVTHASGRAAAWACFALLISAGLTGSSVDLGLLFFVPAAIVCAGATREARPRLNGWSHARAGPTRALRLAGSSPLQTAPGPGHRPWEIPI